MGLENLLTQTSPQVKFIEKYKKLDSRMRKMENQLKGTFWPVFCMLFVGAGLLMGYRFDIEGKGYAFDPKEFPIEAVDWLEDHPQGGEMFNLFQWGGYLQYRLWPEKRVFIDSKSDFFGEDFVRQYVKVIAHQDGWENVLDQYNVDWAILPADQDTYEAFEYELEWNLIYEDETAVILVR